MFEGLRKPEEFIVLVVTLLSYGCPVQAIVHAFGLDERTVAAWRDQAGGHCHKVHQAIIEQGHLDLMHIQADEIRVKGRSMGVWMGLAMMVSTRLWIAGMVQPSRDRSLPDRLLQPVRRCAMTVRPLLVVTDGWVAYPGNICRAFREKVKHTKGPGRACLQVWPLLHIGTVTKRTQKKTRGGDDAADGSWAALPRRAVRCRFSLYLGDGRWTDQSRLEPLRTLELSHRSTSLSVEPKRRRRPKQPDAFINTAPKHPLVRLRKGSYAQPPFSEVLPRK